jgi:hypothetical protein
MTQDAILGISTSEMNYSRFGAVRPRTESWDIFSRPSRHCFVLSNLASTGRALVRSPRQSYRRVNWLRWRAAHPLKVTSGRVLPDQENVTAPVVGPQSGHLNSKRFRQEAASRRTRSLTGSFRWFTDYARAKDSFTAVRCHTRSLSQINQSKQPATPVPACRGACRGAGFYAFHRASQSSETSARSFSLATSRKRSHLCPKIKSATPSLIRK